MKIHYVYFFIKVVSSISYPSYQKGEISFENTLDNTIFSTKSLDGSNGSKNMQVGAYFLLIIIIKTSTAQTNF